ncbi:MAG TPA: hypothetical protein VM617_02075 [Thermoanaerobaculia bacterium]|nr:hypothetical protein [Thermoanaerobaculia bacterium]
MRAPLGHIIAFGFVAALAPGMVATAQEVESPPPSQEEAVSPQASGETGSGDELSPDTPAPAKADPGGAANASASRASWATDLRQTVTSDMARFYRRRRALRFGSVLAAAGALANTDADAEIQQWYRDDVATASGDEWAADLERLGRMETIGLPLLAGGLLVGFAPEEGSRAPVRWLRRTARAYLVGTPALLYLQPLTGGNRPAEGLGSDWRPFVGQNGVSGHAFTGAVPFLTLARQTDRWWLRVLAVAASTAGGWAQLHADQHYFSQFALGWWLAWEATDAVAESDAALLAEPRVAVTPLPVRGGGGVLVSLRF